MEFSWLILAIVFLLALAYLLKQTNGKLPPGPRPVPILGNLHLLGEKPHLVLTSLRAKYGDVYSFKFGSYPGVVLNGHKAIREALTEAAFNGRHMESAAFPREGGIVFSEEKEWAEQRRFTLKTLRDFGFGKKSMESLIMEEVQELLNTFRKTAGTPNNLQLVFNVAVLNTLWSIMAGEKFTHDDPRLHKLISMLNTALQTKSLSVLEKLSFFVSWLHPLRPMLPIGRQIDQFMGETMKLIKDVIQTHKESFQQDQLRDFIDVYLNEIENATAETPTFYGGRGEHNLPIVLFELFVAGTETTASTLTYALQYLALHQESQEKMFEEIKLVVGLTRRPALIDRQNLPYCEAAIYETMRHSSLLPRSIVHKTTEDVNFRGHFIPKNTIVVPNLHSAMHDPTVWGDPEKFRPERFFTKDGALQKHPEALLPFSFGKRICLGESLARDQMFLFLTSLVQQFRFKPDPGSPKFTVEYITTPLILSPVPKLLVLEERPSIVGMGK